MSTKSLIYVMVWLCSRAQIIMGAGISVEQLAPHTAGVCLAEIVAVTEHDQRANDGPLYLELKLRIVRQSGAVKDTLELIKEPGGQPPPPGSPEPAKPSLSTGDAKIGRRYWLAFASDYDDQLRNPLGLLGAWPESNPDAASAFEEAIRADRYRWMPQYDPQSKLTIGHLGKPGEDAWKLHVEKEGKTLWETGIAQKISPHYFDLRLYDQYEGFPAQMPSSGKILVVPTLIQLAAKNEFELPAAQYKLATAYDPQTGNRLAVFVFRVQPGYEKVLYRDYDPAKRAVLREDRFDVKPSGGNALGAVRDEWWQKTSREFNPGTGAVTATQRFFYDERPGVEQRWVALDGTKR